MAHPSVRKLYGRSYAKSTDSHVTDSHPNEKSNVSISVKSEGLEIRFDAGDNKLISVISFFLLLTAVIILIYCGFMVYDIVQQKSPLNNVLLKAFVIAAALIACRFVLRKLCIERLVISLSEAVVSRFGYNKKVDINGICEFRMIPINNDQPARYAIVFLSDDSEFVICSGLSYDEGLKVASSIHAYYPNTSNPYQNQQLGLGQQSLKTLHIKENSMSTRYMKVFSWPMWMKVLLTTGVVIFLPLWSLGLAGRAIHFLKSFLGLDFRTCMKLSWLVIPTFVAFFDRKYIDVTPSTLVTGTYPIGKTKVYPIQAIDDIVMSDMSEWTNCNDYVPCASVYVSVKGVRQLIMDNISIHDAMYLCTALKNAVKVR